MRRLLIWIPVYGLVAIVLPQHPAFQRLVEPLLRIRPEIVTPVILVSLVVSAALIWLMRREPNGWMFRYPGWHMPILLAGLIGMAFSSALDLLQILTGGGANLIYLLLIPAAFMAAEAVAMAIERRIDQGPLGSRDAERGFQAHGLDEELARAQAGKGTSFLAEGRARDFLALAEDKGMVVTTLEVWRVNGDSARLRPDLSVKQSDVKALPADMVMDLIRARLTKALAEADEHVFVMGV